MTMPLEPHNARTLAPAFAADYRARVVGRTEPITITLHPIAAWGLMTVLQHGLQTSDPRSPSVKLAKRATEHLEDELAPDGPLRQMAELGWSN